jgi:hypothetical protein
MSVEEAYGPGCFILAGVYRRAAGEGRCLKMRLQFF